MKFHSVIQELLFEVIVNGMCMGNPYIFTNIEDPDEMVHKVAFHQSTLYLKVIKIFRQINTILLKLIT